MNPQIMNHVFVLRCSQIMADDGSGSDISIPSFLVFKEDADEIKAALKDNTQVRVQMSFKVPAPDARVEYDLWTHPSDPNSRPIEKSWSVAALALAEHASFTPHHYVYDGVRAGCQDANGNNQCYNLCTNNGLYCSTDPDDDLDNGASGADVVVESLRRICLWNLYGKADGVGKPWWDYVTNFIDQCDSFDDPYGTSESKFNDPECVGSAMVAAGVDEQKVNECMAAAGGVGDDVNATNHLLEKEIADQEALGVVLIPSLLVNQAVVRGSLSFSTVLKAVCSGFSAGSEPDICKECANCQDELKCVQTNGYCPASHSDGSGGIGPSSVPIQVFAAVLIGLVVVFLAAVAIQHQRQQRYMNEQIRGIVQEYMPVTSAQGQDTSMAIPQDDDDDDEGNGSGPSSFSIT
uniref:Vacuolar sorting receptor thioredoxin-like domain-containing protein n=1 Tax=Entomoneis paludosa TaxID=265537 RepID=A0A7S2YK90_9STRA|mmetsp:Transcript_36096/g.75068  ORF Transcript_36096/g.75068 Transcript_36096/m.75068 type:complete len:406 (+) Transcript_36096:85-1302(+)